MQIQPNDALSRENCKTDGERYAFSATARWPVDGHPGIYYRLSKALVRTYVVHFEGRMIRVGAKLSDAKTKQAELRAAIGKGEKPVLPSRVSFAELSAQWWETKQPRLRPATEKLYRAALDLVLLPRFGRWQVQAIDADAISELVRDLQKHGLHAINKSRKPRPLGRSSVDGYLSPLQGVLALAVRRGLVSVNPFGVLTEDDRPLPEESEPPHEWSGEELSKLLAASEKLAAKETAYYDYTPLLRLTATLGLRLGEVTGLRWEDFDVHESVLHIKRQWTKHNELGPPKTKAGARRIALPPEIRSMLIDLKLKAKGEDGPIFASRAGTHLQHRNVTRRGFEAARDEAGLPERLTFHDLRHAAASRLIASGLDPVTTATVLGHEDSSVTLRVYAHLFDRQAQDAKIRAALAS